MNATDIILTLTCDKCGVSYSISEDTKRRRIKNGTPFFCKKCMKEHANNKRKMYFNSLSDEEKKKYIEKRNWYSKASDEQKALHAQKSKNNYAKRTAEEQAKINKKNSEGLKKHWANISENDKQERIKNMHKSNKEYWEKMSSEEKSERARQWMKNKTQEELDKLLEEYSLRMKKYNNSLSFEEKQQRTSSMQEWHNNLTKEQKIELYKRTHNWYYTLSDDEKFEYAKSKKEWYNNLSDEEKLIHFNQSMKYWNSLTDEEKRLISLREQERWNNKSEEEKSIISINAKDRWNNLSDEEKRKFSNDRINHWNNLSKEEKLMVSKRQQERWNNLSNEEKAEMTRKILSASGNINKFNQKFEKAFNESHLVNDYYFKPEEVLTNETIHSWDYGIYTKSDNELVMVVDLDGAYFHADSCDYDGIHSKEEYDEKRSLSIPSNIKHFIFQELNFKKCFEVMTKILMLNYDEYVDYIFKMCRNIPFPSPKYSDIELLKSYHKLEIMKCDDKYHKSLSLNTRIGDRIINNFHESIYQAHRKGNISPYDAWYDDKLLRKVIENRIIYQTYLNPNKILHGFNISKVATKVSVFSAGRARMLIYKYLNDCNEIFDPFSGFSGRMLGAVSLGKRYIGQDISPIHVRESNNMIGFLRNNGININAYVTQSNVLKSNGEYECLFTCPPYQDIEQWQDVPVSKRTCDDWIDECLSRFKCRKYLFVVDYTERYLDYVVDEIKNKSHFGSNSEYVILIQR